MASNEEGRWKKPGMVGWYDPGQLAQTGVQVFLSTILGSMIDARRLAAVEGRDEDCVFDYSQDSEVWFDYMADTGDGWDATYTMAYLLSMNQLKVEGEEILPRADFIVLGGDEVYPVASKTEYAKRLVWPFNEASRDLKQYGKREHLRDLYCIPGNHDWYDSLAAFTRRFCSRRRIGSFQTKQPRSYFVINLPHRWHIWAVDVQLGHDIDVPQFAFFRRQAESLGQGDRVILMLAEPDWVYGEQSGENLHYNIGKLEQMVEAQKAEVRVEIAGDIHNYQRYEGRRDTAQDEKRSREGRGENGEYDQTKVVSGGGGAFLHPTHTFGTTKKGDFACVSRYPDAKTSRGLSFNNIFFAIKNWKMASLLGALYLLLFWNVPPDVDLLSFPLAYPATFLLVLVLLASLWAFADTSGIKRVLWGLIHGFGHITLAVTAWKLSIWLMPSWTLHPALELYLPRVVVFLLGGLLGGTLFGLYLLVSVSLFRIHENEAFSSLRVADYKHFIRCKVSAGGLRFYAVGVPSVASQGSGHPVPVKVVDTFSIR